MSTGSKILYGIFLFIPIIMIVLIEVEIFSNVDLGNYGGILKAMQRSPEGTMTRILLYMGIAVFCNLAALIFNMIHLMRNKAVPENSRLTWILVLLLTGIVGQLIYFFKFMARSKPN